jgi:hypothetical protein
MTQTLVTREMRLMTVMTPAVEKLVPVRVMGKPESNHHHRSSSIIINHHQ